jgi:hypothetical protein
MSRASIPAETTGREPFTTSEFAIFDHDTEG